jgi:ATP-dependent RNA circularization protein (DNA/RNA ligase family)
MCVVLRGREASAVGVYLTDLGHYRDVRRRFRETVEEYGKDYMFSLMRRIPFCREEMNYLRKVIWGI